MPDKRIAFITGGASGIGFGIACACAEADMHAVLADRDGTALTRAAEVLRAHAEGDVSTIELDVSVPDQWREAACEVEARHGGLHLLCNNAGVTGSGRVAGELDAEEWDRVVAVNLGSAFFGVTAMLPLLRGHGDAAHIVNTASMAALLPYAGGAAYAASKAGLLAYSECLAAELMHSAVGVSVLLPAQVRTNLFRTSMDSLGETSIDFMDRRGRDARSLEADGQDPLAVGRRVLAAVRAGTFYIVTHPELHAVVGARFARILAAMSDDPPARDAGGGRQSS